MDPEGFEPSASALQVLKGTREEYRLKDGEIQEYFEYRKSKVKSDKTLYWIEKSIRELMNHTKGKINRKTLIKFQNWFKSKYGYQSQCKFHDNTKNLLEWLYKKTGDTFFRDLQDVLERPTRDSKKLNEILVREADIKNVIKATWRIKIPKEYRIKYVAAILFAAYTGQRPDATISKLTYNDFKDALSRKPPIIYIPEEKDKERFPHWVPIHPVVAKWLKKALELHKQGHKDDDEIVFTYYAIKKVFDKINVKAIHTGRKITYSHLRKFFEQMCNNVLVVNVDGRTVPAVHPGLRDYIMSHNTGSLDVQSYDGKLPSEIYEQYMAAWKDVNLVPPNLKKVIK